MINAWTYDEVLKFWTFDGAKQTVNLADDEDKKKTIVWIKNKRTTRLRIFALWWGNKRICRLLKSVLMALVVWYNKEKKPLVK